MSGSSESLMHEQQFPILKRDLYANHAAIAPWSQATADAVAAFAAENARAGPAGYREWIARERALRKQFSELIGASGTQDIALLKNTTEGICAVAFGFPWRRGDNVVVPTAEFPSNRLPWLAQEARGVAIREVDIRGDDGPETALIEAMDDRTRVLAVSSVQFNDGLRLDLVKLAEACASADVLFFVDAIQHLGALPFDVTAAGADCVAADAHKWMLGPEGVAVFYCGEKARSKLALTQVGWHMFENPWNFDRSDWTPAKSARRFEAGSPNTLGQVATHASLALLLDTRMENIAARVLANTARLSAGLSGMPGVRVHSPLEPARQSGIVSFSVDDAEPRVMFKRLMEAGVTCALRDGKVRLSPHFYQDETVIERLLQHVEDSL